MRYETARELVETILDQLDEGPTPSPKPKKYGFEDRMSRTEPKRKFSWEMTSDEKKKYFGNKGSKPVGSIREGERPQDTNWDRVNMDSRKHAQRELFPKRKPTSVDAHLPGGAAAALKRSRAAFARKLKEAIDQLDEELTKGAKAMARGHMIKRYGKGKVTFSSGSNGHYAEHDDGKGDTASHTFHPKTGKISREPRVTSSYYGESTTITEGAVKGLLNDMGYFFTDEGEHAGKWVHEKTGKALSDDHATKIAAERHARKKKSVGNKDSAAFKRGH